MDPTTLLYLTKARVEELHREAEQYRLADKFRPEDGIATRIRSAAGNRLIALGKRLLPGSTTQPADSPC